MFPWGIVIVVCVRVIKSVNDKNSSFLHNGYHLQSSVAEVKDNSLVFGCVVPLFQPSYRNRDYPLWDIPEDKNV